MTFETHSQDLLRQVVIEALADVQVRAATSATREYLTPAETTAGAAVSKDTVRNEVKAGMQRTYGAGRVLGIRKATRYFDAFDGRPIDLERVGCGHVTAAPVQLVTGVSVRARTTSTKRPLSEVICTNAHGVRCFPTPPRLARALGLA